jgi:hypothetical protein
MRTDRKGGFLLDRGFQVFNTSYPQVKRRLDLRMLRLRPFTPSVITHTPTGPVRLAELYATDTGVWQLIATYTVEGALPAMRPPWPLSRTTRFASGRYVCGDHRATGSVQGALASGTRAAREVLTDLAHH